VRRIWGYVLRQPLQPTLANLSLGLAPGASVAVFDAGTTTPATLFADAGAQQPMANPLTADRDGYYEFHTAARRVRLRCSGGGILSPYTIDGVSGGMEIGASRRDALPPPARDGAGRGTLAYVTDHARGIWADQGDRWFATNAQTFNVKEFGAVGDGRADDTRAIQSALDAVYETIAGAGRHGIVVIPPGVYRVRTLFMHNTPARGKGLVSALVGAGMSGTTLLLDDQADAPALDLGGAEAGQANSAVLLADFMVVGNKARQRRAAPLLRARRLDRSWFHRLFVRDSKGAGIELVGCTVSVHECQMFSSDSHGVLVDASNSVTFQDCFHNNNQGAGAYVRFTNAGIGATPPVVRPRDCNTWFLHGHFENNVGGEIIIDGVDHTTVQSCLIDPQGTQPFAIRIAGAARDNQIVGNWFYLGGADNPTGTRPGSSVARDFNAIVFGPQTYDNAYGWNTRATQGADAGVNDYRVQVLDLGRNYAFDWDHHPQQFAGALGGAPMVAWTTAGVTNHCLSSEDLANRVWVRQNVSSVSPSAGSPWNLGSSPAGSADRLTFAATPPRVVGTITQTLAALPFAEGDLVTFSVWLREPDWAPGRATDIHLRILDAGGTVLSDTNVRPRRTWERWATSFVAARRHASLQVQLYKVQGGSSDVIEAWGAQCNRGDLGAYVPTAAAAATVQPGCYAPRMVATKGLQIGVQQGDLGTIGGYYTVREVVNLGPVAPGAYAQTTLAVPGAAVGDAVVVGHEGLTAAGAVLQGVVTAPGTVSVGVYNFRSTPLTVAGHARIGVIHHLA
jgi:hypothetical protein